MPKKKQVPPPANAPFTDARKADFLLSLVELGSLRAAAARSRVSYVTVYDHAKKDEGFREAIEDARGAYEAHLVQTIRTAATEGEVIETQSRRIVKPGDWRAAAWLLEHGYTRDQYAGILKQKVELGGAVDLPPVQLDSPPDAMQIDIGPDTMERLAVLVSALIGAGKLRLPDPGETINVTPEDDDEVA